jgi:hypothetical protein
MNEEKKVILGVTDSYGNNLPDWIYTQIYDSQEKKDEAMKVNTFISIAKKIMEAGDTVRYDAETKTLKGIYRGKAISFQLV